MCLLLCCYVSSYTLLLMSQYPAITENIIPFMSPENVTTAQKSDCSKVTWNIITRGANSVQTGALDWKPCNHSQHKLMMSSAA